MANAPNYTQQHFDNYISSARYQSDLIAFINNGGTSDDFQSQIDDLQAQITANDADIAALSAGLSQSQILSRISIGV